MSEKKVFVTGSNGFIGSHLVDRLVECGYNVTALIRENSDLTFLPVEKITLHKGDLRDFNSLKEGMAGCKAVFHIGAMAADWGEKQEFYNINVVGTKNILQVSKANGIKQIVFISSTAVLGEEDSLEVKSEESPYNPEMSYFLSSVLDSGMNYYKSTKMLAEKECIDFSKLNDINLTVLRPVWVYGPREFHAGPYEFCKTVLEGCPILPMGKSNKFHVVYVEDLVDAIMLAFEKNLSGTNIFNIGNEEAPNIREYFNLFCKHLGVKPPFYTSLEAIYPISIVLEGLAYLLKAKEPYLLTRARVKMFYCNNIYETSKAKELLGFTPKTSLEVGVKKTVDWWINNKFLKDNAGKKLEQRYVTGIERTILDIRMALTVAIKYFLRFLSGKISLKQYYYCIKRLIILSDLLKKYKAVCINNTYKTNLYLAAFPTPAFYKAVDKFLNLDGETVASHVVLSMTNACAYNCSHCYQKQDSGQDLPIDQLIKTAQALQDLGISLLNIEGGEPLIRFERLMQLLNSLDNRSEIWINTTGYSLTYEKALTLKEANVLGMMISIHHWDSEKHDSFVGKKGAFDIACNSIKMFQKAGLSTVINCCPSLEMINDSGIEKMLDLARSLNCGFIQIIHEKPAGGWVHRGNSLMDKDLLNSLCDKTVAYNTKKGYESYPSILMQVFESSPDAFGCTAGGIERFYINANGEVQPCEFMNISCGNVQDEDFMVIYKRMREKFKKPTLNWLCNTECELIDKFIRENNITDLPIKKEYALALIDQFDKGEYVPLFERMKICDKV